MFNAIIRAGIRLTAKAVTLLVLGLGAHARSISRVLSAKSMVKAVIFAEAIASTTSLIRSRGTRMVTSISSPG